MAATPQFFTILWNHFFLHGKINDAVLPFLHEGYPFFSLLYKGHPSLFPFSQSHLKDFVHMTIKVLKTTLFLIKSIYCLYTVPYKALVRYPKKSKKIFEKFSYFVENENFIKFLLFPQVSLLLIPIWLDKTTWLFIVKLWAFFIFLGNFWLV